MGKKVPPKETKQKTSCFTCGRVFAFLVLFIASFIGICVVAISDVGAHDNFLPFCTDNNGELVLCEIPVVESHSYFIEPIKAKLYSLTQNVIVTTLKFVLSTLGKSSLPPVEQEYNLDGITADVRIFKDEHGIPSITAESFKDAIFGQGFAMAQDRLYQLEVNRRVCKGRLSELFGDKAKETDAFARTLGFNRLNFENATELYDALSIPFTSHKSKVNTLECVNAFVDGINAYMNSPGFKMPVEFTVLGKKSLEPFELSDIQCWTRFNYLIMAKGWSREIALSLIENRIGSVAEDLQVEYSSYFPGYPSGNSYINTKSQENTQTNLSNESNSDSTFSFPNEDVAEIPGVTDGQFGGSNAFVLSGDITENGKPMLFGDPHLPPVLPSMWYRFNLKVTGDEPMSVIGATTNLIPFSITSRTPEYASAVTLANIDVDDTYIVKFEKLDNGKLVYHSDGQLLEPVIITDTIFSKDSQPEEIEIIHTKYGVVISDVLDLNVSENGVVSEKPNESKYEYKLTLLSTGLHPDVLKESNMDHTILSFMANSMFAKNIEEYKQSISFCPNPPLNFLYADVHGDIGNFVTGRVPIRQTPRDGLFPSKSWLGENTWTRYCTWDEMPLQHNPAKGFIVSANHKNGNFYPVKNTFGQGFRALRMESLINQTIQQNGKITLEDGKRIQRDAVTIVGLEFQKRFFSVPGIDNLCNRKNDDPDSKLLCDALDTFRKWNGSLDVDSSAACIYQAVYYSSILDLFQKSVGSDMMPLCIGKGLQPVINPSTELVLSISTVFLNILDSSIKSESTLTNSIPSASSFWVESAGGVEDLLKRNFIRGVRYLGNHFAEKQHNSKFDVSSWRWGDIHHTIYSHSMGKIHPIIDKVLSPTIEAKGDTDTVFMSQVVPYKYDFNQLGWGVSYRQAHDLSVEQPGESIAPPGNSGQFGSVAYDSLVSIFAKGGFLKNEYEIPENKASSKHFLNSNSKK